MTDAYALQYLKTHGLYDGGCRKRFAGEIPSPYRVPWQNCPDTAGYYRTDDGFTAFITDSERGLTVWKKKTPSKEQAIRALIDKAALEDRIRFCRLFQENHAVFQKELKERLEKTYGYAPKNAERTIDYLSKDERVFFEFAYFILLGRFVPKPYAVKIRGFSAEYLYEKTCLTATGAFSYLIYLKEKPKQALTNLAAGLPRK